MAKSSKSEETLGNRVETLRLTLGYTMSELAKRVGVSHVQISNYENDTQSPTSVILGKLATHLETSSDFLLYGKPSDELVTYFNRVRSLSGSEQRKVLEYLRERFEIDRYKKLKLKPFGDLIEKDL